MGSGNSILDLYQGKMYALNGNHTIKQIISSNAPIGNIIYQLSGSTAIYHTLFIPIGKDLNYKLRIWIRKISNDTVLSGSFYVGAAYQDYQRSNIMYNSCYACYYINGKEGSLLNSQWEFVQFFVGSNQQLKIPSGAKFMSIYFLINWGNGCAIYEACGGSIIEI